MLIVNSFCHFNLLLILLYFGLLDQLVNRLLFLCSFLVCRLVGLSFIHSIVIIIVCCMGSLCVGWRGILIMLIKYCFGSHYLAYLLAKYNFFVVFYYSSFIFISVLLFCLLFH